MVDRLRILVYLTGGDHWIAGIQYTRNLIRALALLPPDERPAVVLKIGAANAGKGYEEEFSAYPFVAPDRPLEPWAPWEVFGRKVLRKISRRFGGAPAVTLSDRCTVAFPAKAPDLPGPQEKIFWVPDFQYKRLPELFPVDDIEARNRRNAKMFAGEGILVLSSEAVRRDFMEFFPDASGLRVRILRFHTVLGDADTTADAAEICARYGLPEKFAYVPNQLSLHKGHDTLLEATAALKRRGVEIPVVCTGSAYDYRSTEHLGALSRFSEKNGLQGLVRFLGVVPRADQIQLFRRAAIVVQPSRFEGWSTVVEDARALGKDVLASDLDVHREQAPEHGSFFRTGDAEDLAACLEERWPACRPGPDLVRESDALRRSRGNGLKFARDFMRIAEEAHSLYLSKRPNGLESRVGSVRMRQKAAQYAR